jgi:5-methyltetrahydrofolate--homocysteine methyltransferase
MPDLAERRRTLEELIAQRILILDGAMGTMLEQRRLNAEDYGGASYEGCNENLVRTRPDVVLAIHRAYLEAGADIIETNSFGGAGIVLDEYGLRDHAREINLKAARLARQAAIEFSSHSRPRFVAGAMGPTTKAISVTGGVTFAELTDSFYTQSHALIEGGSDLLLLETCQDTRNVKAALVAIEHLRHAFGQPIPVLIAGTIEATGTMLAGQTVEAMYASVAHFDVLGMGLNCATGPEFMTDHLRALSDMSRFAVSCHPNAGLPDEEGRYLETPESLARKMEIFADRGWLNVAGGCCGTTQEHIRAIAEMAQGKQPRRLPNRPPRSYYSGVDFVEAEEANRPLLVGERANIIGSRLFKQTIAAEDWEEASEIARRQMKWGANIVDVCLQSADRDELSDIPPFYSALIAKVRAPIMVDSTDPSAVELALTYCQGKSIINSVNLEDGERKFNLICPLVKRYGAALVAGCIDEDRVRAQAFTRERKLEVATRSYKLLTEKYGIPPEDVILDPLVFPCATGDPDCVGGAVETIEAIRFFKRNLPHAKTIAGISNVSFGLPPAAREVVNSVFLHHCTKAGLDLAIVNAEKLERFASIPEPERRLAENLLFNSPPAIAEEPELCNAPQDWRAQSHDQRAAINRFHIVAITGHFRQTERPSKSVAQDVPLDRRIANHIIQGSKDGLIAALDQKMAEGAAPLEIINGPLMDGMSEVGRLFNNNELIVAEVLQSAETMKAAVDYVQRFLEKSRHASRGKILLATVKGDVHDIGKNLAEIILANNGYDVIDLGIKVTPAALISAYFEHKPDAIGLSGLLVKSALQMVATASDLQSAGIQVPLLTGGAALSEKFTRTRIASVYGGEVLYAKDAMAGLKLMNEIVSSSRAAATPDATPAPIETAIVAAIPEPQLHRRKGLARRDLPIPPAPYLDRRTLVSQDLDEIWRYLNPYMLFGRHLGYKGNFANDLEQREAKAVRLFDQIEALKTEAHRFMQLRAVWRFFEAERDGNSINLFAPDCHSPLHTFRFRSREEDGLCLSDYVLDPRDGHRDHVALYAASAGLGIRERAAQCKQAGEFFNAHAIQALALETAEAASEWLHCRLRDEWGFPDPPATTMQDRFTSKYRGKRYSFGYPACPDLDDQQGLWKLLAPEDIGIQLTESMMMDPEASVSAIVFHHPDCIYFAADEPA